MTLMHCPICDGTARNPEAPATIAEDDGTCPVCCNPAHPWYAAYHGRVQLLASVHADSILQHRLAVLAQ